MPPILNKRDFVRRYDSGEFGNASPTWNTIEGFEDSEYRKEYSNLCHIRNRVPGGPTYYNLRADLVKHTWEALVVNGVQPTSLYISLMAPTELTKLQGEVKRGANGLELRFNCIRKPMREAFAISDTTVVGLRAKLFLQGDLNTKSYEWLGYLLDEYKDHIVEFSTYSKCWGTVPGHNTVFWEVRPDRSFGSNVSRHTEVY